jgi:tetratricopeptide (TPR) repeat protein
MNLLRAAGVVATAIALLLGAEAAAGRQVVEGASAGRGGRAALEIPLVVASTHVHETSGRIEREIHAAVLAKDEAAVRDAHIERALILARQLANDAPDDADAHYWLGVALGLRTEYSGAFSKLTSGKACYEATARALELDPDHAGAHELLGRIHAGVMRLPWLVRKLGGSLGMNDALGQASWESAEEHFVRAAELDPRAISPRLELGKLLDDRERPEEARAWLQRALEISPDGDLDAFMQSEASELLGGSGV